MTSPASLPRPGQLSGPLITVSSEHLSLATDRCRGRDLESGAQITIDQRRLRAFSPGAGKVTVISVIHSPTYSFVQEADSGQMLLAWGLVPTLEALTTVTAKAMVKPSTGYAFRGE